jgi:hypothetical protein
MITAILLQSASASTLPDDAWVRVSATVGISQSATTINFIKDPEDTDDGEYTLRLISKNGDGSNDTRWATSRTCSGVRKLVENLNSVPFPAITSPSDTTELIVDGVTYSVIFSARYGSQFSGPLELRSNIDTPLETWVNNAIATAKPCWSGYRRLNMRH